VAGRGRGVRPRPRPSQARNAVSPANPRRYG
jgi:hypothetical protein